MSDKTDFAQYDKKWQKKWQEKKLYQTDIKNAEKPFYNLMMFPYPSGKALHVGHWFNFGGADSYGRFMQMQGYEVFEPMGFDSFGLPAENYAIKHDVHPQDSIAQNIDYMRKQLRCIGAMFDWSREVQTSSPDYYRWTQWVFIQMYKAGLAVRKEAPVNFCPSCQTVLANEQAEGGICERCDSEVVQKSMTQWFFKITDYADRLLENLSQLDWPDRTKLLQRNWIGRKEGIEITYRIENSQEKVTVFTTRPDTNFGATFIVLAPEHPLVAKVTKKEYQEQVEKYKKEAATKNNITRLDTTREKTGVFTGSYAINDLTDYKMPIYVADYVLMEYGTGAVVGVPGHDKRDYEFASKYDIPILRVIVDDAGYDGPIDSLDKVFEDEGRIINSEFLNGLHPHDAIPKMMDHLEEKGVGQRKTTYRLRDWSVSRQRYWGVPIPIIYCEKCGVVPVPEENLPVELPREVDFRPKGKAPLATVSDFINTTCPNCQGPATREAETLDTFVCSSWYYLRYPCTHLDNHPFDKEILAKWMPVDMYIGGIEHACMHLLYARFINMVLYDQDLVPTEEPFKKLRHQGLIIKDGAKMSKSKGNVVNPDRYVEEYGADIFRMYLLFMGPFEEGGDFSDEGIVGIQRFLKRVVNLVREDRGEGETKSDLSMMHKVIKEVTHDYQNLKFNTVMARLMEYETWLKNSPEIKGSEFEKAKINLVKMIAPLAPHVSEEIWSFMKERWQEKGWDDYFQQKGLIFADQESIHQQSWPEFKEALTIDEEVTIVVQVNGKVRSRLTVPRDLSSSKIESLIKQDDKIVKYLEGKEPQKIIHVANKLVNLVI